LVHEEGPPEVVAPFQRLLGDAWIPTPGWQPQLGESLMDWLRALERVNRPGTAE
jgi:hypothetical protein